MATYNEALKLSTEYFDGDDLAAEVYLGKYALTDPKTGEILEPTPADMHKRLAKEFARIEKKYLNPLSEKEIFEFFDKFKRGIPQGSPMAALGNKNQFMSLSNCQLVAAPHDSFGGILLADQELAQLYKRRSGVGIDLSTLRPKGMSTNNAAKNTDGISVFMERFSNTTREVAINGRRGALMETISVHHPEIETFINIKKDRKRVTGANISVKLSDEFMEAVKQNKDYQLQWPVDSKNPKISKMVSAKKIWNQIIDSAWDSAEPGILFWDTALKYTPAECYKNFGFKHEGTNPCSEIILSPYDSCRLFLLNLMGYVKEPYTKNSSFDLERLYKDAQIGQKIMDDLVDLEAESIDKILNKIKKDPEPKEVKAVELNLWKKIKKNCINGRRTGLGITGLGDTIAACNMQYGSKDSIKFTEEIYKTLCLGSYRASVTLAKERGAFPVFNYNLEKNHPFLKRVWKEDKELYKDYLKYGRRNISNLTTAPAGSVSILSQTTSGIEPVFKIYYKRRRKINSSDKLAKIDFTDQLGDTWQEYNVYHHGFKKWMEITGNTERDIEKSPYWKATSSDIDWESAVDLQAAAAKWVDHSISKTCNLPKDISKEIVSKVYMRAWESGCKGFTVYREGSRSGVLVSIDDKIEKNINSIINNKDRKVFHENHAPKRPKDLLCDIYHMTVKGEKWNIFVGLFEGRPYEVFAGRANFVDIPKSRKNGSIKKNGVYNLHIGEGDNEIVIKDLSTVFDNPTEAAFTRTVSLAFRHGTPVQYVVEQIEKGANKDSEMFSLAKALLRVLKNYIKNGTKASSALKKCPQCGSFDLAYLEGCISCVSCRWSKCS